MVSQILDFFLGQKKRNEVSQYDVQVSLARMGPDV